ncbi:class I SAM-dependent methyltransferase [Mesobacillus subterraneus]|uniref:Class I SAM-dependent methyltransferase n=1 Tax=Mesobacillus subterraneus TaxID=285983 RepID=A0A3R9FUJ1_9BACI|nr:class I SAM-dependent methyltransferase [Mesobacillus subterraneus]RSD25411.1 class I SAM-dependent methyltransferase [Mesobacillus subterraneus]
MNDQMFDRKLNIKTTGEQMGFMASLHYHRYEPTPYSALERFFEDYKLEPRDKIVDFGCGKGRLNFYLNHRFNNHCIGVEMNELFYYEALENKLSYLKRFKNRGDRINFHSVLAEEYDIQNDENRFYFFNPFTVQIFMNVVNNILLSFENSPRELDLILYYPSEDYIFYLENQSPFELVNEVNLPDQNPNERFLVYRIGPVL